MRVLTPHRYRRQKWFSLGRIDRPRYFPQRKDLVICVLSWIPLGGGRPRCLIGVGCHPAHAHGQAFALIGEFSLLDPPGAN